MLSISLLNNDYSLQQKKVIIKGRNRLVCQYIENEVLMFQVLQLSIYLYMEIPIHQPQNKDEERIAPTKEPTN